MILKGKNIRCWQHVTPLSSGDSISVKVGMENATRVVADCLATPFFRCGLYSSHDSRLTVQGSSDPAFSYYETLLPALDASAGVYATLYDLTGSMENNGWLTLTQPFIRLVLSDQATSDHTVTRLWAQAWG